MSALTLRNTLRWLLIIGGVALVVGAAGAGFLHALDWITLIFNQHRWLLFILPALGLLSVWVYQAPAKASAGGVKALIARINRGDIRGARAEMERGSGSATDEGI